MRKYNIDENMFKNIDSEFKAYLLGWIISDGHIGKHGFTIEINKKDINILLKLRDGICSDLNITDSRNNIRLIINSTIIRDDLLNILNLESYGKKSDIVGFPELKEEFIIPCIRGIFDGDGHVVNLKKYRSPQCTISSSSEKLKNKIKELIDIPCSIDHRHILFSGSNCLDFLGKIYYCSGKLKPDYCLDRKFYTYEKWSFYIPALSGFKSENFPEFKVLRTDNRAVLPNKVRSSDSGYDLTIIEEYKKYGEVTLYKTGIKAQIEHGWYLEIIPRSSIIKSGYMLANSVAVIDRSYIGEIFVPLIKVDKNAKDIELPCKLVQLVPKPIVNFQVVEVKSEQDLGYTSRAENGFGSSGR